MRRRLRIVGILLVVVLVLFLVLPFIIPIDETGTGPHTFADEGGRFIEVDGINTYVLEKGEPNAPAVIFIHGLYGSTFVWRYNADAIAEAGFRVVLFDRPGAGLSEKPIDFNYSHANNADFTAHLMDALAIEQAAVVGHSAGGNIAVHFAGRHPERITQLVLVDPALITGIPPFVGPIVSFPPIYRWGRIGLQRFFTAEQLIAAVRGFHADPSFLTDTDYAGYWRAFQTPGWDAGILGLTRDSGGNRLTSEQLVSFAVPTLLIWGEADPVTPISQMQQVMQMLSITETLTYEGIGHQPMEEHAGAFNRDVITFLSILSSVS
jgi:pimeloyl-ACP methyl ester carboxylesterase